MMADGCGKPSAQMVTEVDVPRSGGIAMLARLTEILFIEILRHRIMMTEQPGATGWLAALGDRSLSRCLSLIHAEPARDWTLEELSRECATSRSVLAERFQAVLANVADPISARLAALSRPHRSRHHAPSDCRIAQEAGYATEAAFSRAFSRAYGIPPGTWRLAD